METKPISLIKWLEEKSKTTPNEFPGNGKINYFVRYQGLEEYLNNQVHPQVEKLAMLKDGGYLNDHGPEHIRTVIARASDLVVDPDKLLSPYEVYLLLAAIHFHDVGNIYGRKGHEAKHSEVMKRCSSLLGDDSVEMRLISQIAKAHGGTPKDSITHLPKGEKSNSKKINMQQLAAILRFADELADDKDRAARFPMQLEMIPKSSQVYHQYAAHLHSVIVDSRGGAIDLSFQLNEDAVTQKFGKGDGEVFLIDEIFERTVKMHLERSYCVRFMRQVAPIDRINVDIEIWSREDSASLKQIQYRLEETGYPDAALCSIHKLCPSLVANGQQITGTSVQEEILKQKGTK